MRKIVLERSSRVFDGITFSASRVADLAIEEMKLWEMPRLKAGRGGAVFGGLYSSSFNSYSCKSCRFRILMKMKGILGCRFMKKTIF